MALVEPFLGHLLSKHAEVVREGLQKIQNTAERDKTFSTEFLMHPQGFSSIQELLLKPDVCPMALQTVTRLVEACDNAGVRSGALRDMCRGKSFWIIRKALSVISDEMLPTSMAALQFLACVAMWIPKVILARFENTVPIHLAVFRTQLSYTHRRLRILRARFLIHLVSSPHATSVESVVCTHGYLTHLLEDAAELLQEGTEAGVETARASLRVLREQFLDSRISPAQKRAVLFGQRHIIRLLVKALDFEPVSEYAVNILYRMTVELLESPSDYQVMRVDAEDRGMPNYLLFFILRHLRPKSSSVSARLVTFILHQAPDLIRPYFTRVSGHLADDGNTGRISPTTATVSALNVMTRAMLTPIPYHLATGKATLQPIDAKAVTFFNLSAQHVADEVCPVWIAEYVHRLINTSTDLLMLAFAMQLTHAALTRAKTVQRLVGKIQKSQGLHDEDIDQSENNDENLKENIKDNRDDDCDFVNDAKRDYNFYDNNNNNGDDTICQQDWETYDAKVQTALIKALPRREEFWHRMTQQLHPLMLSCINDESATSMTNSENAGRVKRNERIAFLSQRMFLLMELYAEVFHLRVSWLSAVPSYLPTFRASCAHPITDALRRGESIVNSWPALSISALCSLLVSALAQGVSMTKLHHVTMSSPRGGVLEWPLLLSVMLWAVKHRQSDDEETQQALAWVARLIQWTVHSTTVRFMCEVEEAYLWLHALDEETLPCFVHLINHLLQRSLSKAADRVAQELMEGNSGVLVCAARTFLAKLEDKASQNDPTSAVNTIKEKTNTKNFNTNNNNNNNARIKQQAAQNGIRSKELWSEDMRDHVAAFRVVTDRVAEQWDSRVKHMRVALPAVFESHEENFGKRRIALTRLQVETEHRARRAPNEQLLHFCRTLRPPVECTLGGTVEFLAALRGMTSETDFAQLVANNGQRPSHWCREPAIGWQLAANLLQALDWAGNNSNHTYNKEPERGKDTSRLIRRAAKTARALLRMVVEDVTEVTLAMEEQCRKEGACVGFLVFILAAMRVLLHERSSPSLCSSSSSSSSGKTSESKLEKSTVYAMERLLLRLYGGTISTADRVCYAALLTLHYIQQDPNRNQMGESVKPHDDHDSVRDGVDDEEDDKIDEKEDAEDDTDGECEDDEEAGTARVFAGAPVPQALLTGRFLISAHESGPHVTPEVDMLSLLVDTWTDEEVVHAALQCPARLHNTVFLGGRSGPGLLRSVFPELAASGDAEMAPFHSITSVSVMDPRYMLPLLHCVLALPEEQMPRKNIGTKWIPLMLRALSFTDPLLRCMGATVVSSVWAPNGPTRIVIGFARLKLSQMDSKFARAAHSAPRSTPSLLQNAKQEESQRRPKQPQRPSGGNEEAKTDQSKWGKGGGQWVCPRLPAPLSAFLVMALRPLGDPAYPLHNDIVRFLHETPEAFSALVPLSRCLTTFPLGCITTPLMIQRAEQAQRVEMRTSIASSSADEVVRQLRTEAPAHLEFIVRLVRHSCQTNGDLTALIRSHSLQALMMLASMVSASVELRLQFVRCLHDVCVTSTAVARQAIHEGHLLSWLLGFAHQLHMEYDTATHLHAEPLFMEVLQLLKKLCPLTAPAHKTEVWQQVELLRNALDAQRVTAKDVLDAVDAIKRAIVDQDEGSSHFIARQSKRKRPLRQGRPIRHVKKARAH